jgi:aminoglycoside 6'-N-acetyltransferase
VTVATHVTFVHGRISVMTDERDLYGGDGERIPALTWRPLAATDFPVLSGWLNEPQVARWWHQDASAAGIERDFGPSVRDEELGEDLVVFLGGTAVGFLQRARISDYRDDLEQFSALVEVPGGAVTIDYFLAEAPLRGRGLGTRLIKAAVEQTWTDYPDAPAVIVAVVAANIASWRALEKAGLMRVAEGPMTPDNPIDDPLHYVYRVDRPAPAGDTHG